MLQRGSSFHNSMSRSAMVISRIESAGATERVSSLDDEKAEDERRDDESLSAREDDGFSRSLLLLLVVLVVDVPVLRQRCTGSHSLGAVMEARNQVPEAPEHRRLFPAFFFYTITPNHPTRKTKQKLPHAQAYVDPRCETGVSGSTWVCSNFSFSFVARRTRQVVARSSTEDLAEKTMMCKTRHELMQYLGS